MTADALVLSQFLSFQTKPLPQADIDISIIVDHFLITEFPGSKNDRKASWVCSVYRCSEISGRLAA